MLFKLTDRLFEFVKLCSEFVDLVAYKIVTTEFGERNKSIPEKDFIGIDLFDSVVPDVISEDMECRPKTISTARIIGYLFC
ncbi:hypothetical protein BRC97_06555 [Halobacteriales archaeon QS_6_71_20]|nr:MAG: hypothetical protein BRC97_06555 [Halobacteriales archaeon QS_6_71_20]